MDLITLHYHGQSTIGNSLIKLSSWCECDLQCKQLALEMVVQFIFFTKYNKYTDRLP